MKQAAVAAVFALLVAASPAATAAPLAASPYRVQAEIDWGSLVLSVRVELDAAAAGLRLPAGRLEAERSIERDLAGILKDATFPLRVDARRDFGDAIADGSLAIDDFLRISAATRLRETHFSKDMRTFVANYELPLLALSAPFVLHSGAAQLSAAVELRPTKPYTGIVIYAKGPLPIRGEPGEGILRPCFFPRVFDDEMNLIVERNAVSPEALRSWGEVGYVAAATAALEARVGEEPLRIAAAALFGARLTDLVISRDDALKILGRAENRALVAAGRVVILVDGTSETASY